MCPTRNRRQWIPTMLQSFLSQDYPNLELVIVADGDDIQDLLPTECGRKIRLYHLPHQEKVGEKRNLACSVAEGEYIAHFDDDDWSSSIRISHQMSKLLANSETPVHGFTEMPFFDSTGAAWLYTGTPTEACGTSLVYSKAWWEKHKFRSIDLGEDKYFVLESAARKALASEPSLTEDGYLMYATTHPNNTGRRTLNPPHWSHINDPDSVPLVL